MILGVVIVTWLAASFAMLHVIRSRRTPPFAELVPAELASSIETLRLTTRDGEQIGAWFLDATRDDAPSVLELHGKGGSRGVRLGAGGVVRERGAAVLFVTLRAHGDSSGDIEDFGWSARHDVIAAVDWLERRRPGRPIRIHGASLGAAAAVFAGAELGERVSSYALACLYEDLPSAARARCRYFLPPIVEDVAYCGLRTAAYCAWSEYEQISPLEAIAKIPRSSSILLLAGGADEYVDRSETDALYNRVADHARLVVIAGAAHDRLQSSDPVAYRRAILQWLDGR